MKIFSMALEFAICMGVCESLCSTAMRSVCMCETSSSSTSVFVCMRLPVCVFVCVHALTSVCVCVGGGVVCYRRQS